MRLEWNVARGPLSSFVASKLNGMVRFQVVLAGAGRKWTSVHLSRRLVAESSSSLGPVECWPGFVRLKRSLHQLQLTAAC
jgi:hypothetical protein